MKRVFVILLAALLLFCGAGAAASSLTTLSVDVFDTSDGNKAVGGASVVLVGATSSTLYTTSSGTAEFTVEYPKTYTVTVSKSGYVPQTKSIEVKEAKQRLPVYLSPESPILITVVSSGKAVSGADVTINGKSAGKTDANGRIHASMTRGAYNTVSVSAPSYVSYSKEIFLEKDASAYTVELSVSRVNPLILVYSEDKEPVSGAAVYLNGNLAAYTDSYGRAQLASYTAGTYTVKVEAANFAAYSSSIAFTEESTSATVTLSRSASTLTVKTLADGKPVSDSVIYFDGDIKGITDANGVYKTSAAPGTKILISASHEGYNAEGVLHTVTEGAENIVIIEMQGSVPVVLIGIGVLAVVILILILALVISGRRRKPVKSPAKSYPPTQKRDSF